MEDNRNEKLLLFLSVLMKKFLKILGVILLVVVLAFAGFIVFLQSISNDTITKDDGVAGGYNERIHYTQQLEHKYAQSGPHAVTQVQQTSENPAIGQYYMYVPKSAENTTAQTTFPLIVMVNGTRTPTSDYLPILEHLASWGFIVIGNQDPQTGSGKSASETLDFALAQNTLPESPLFQLINTNSIGISGHSQGGAGAINAVTKFPNSKAFSSLYTASGISHFIAKTNDVDYDTSQITIPAFFMAGTGGEDRFMISSHKQLRKNFDAVQSTEPTIKARRTGVDHKDVLEYGDPYMTAWFLWTLTTDTEASGVFVGANPELNNNPDWQDVATKNLP